MKKDVRRDIASELTTIVKRDGSLVPFDIRKVIRAVEKAMHAASEFKGGAPERIAEAVLKKLSARKESEPEFTPTVEGVQDSVEAELMLHKFPATAKAYILYRANRTREREERGDVPFKVRALAAESKKYFDGNPLGEFVYLRSYSRWIESEGRRETWVETVDRYVAFMKENLGAKLSEEEYAEVREAILRQEVMPSMRLMQFAGEPARRCNTCAYNCTFIAPTKLEDFAEIMYLSMQGCGVGFTVESQNIEQLPQIQKQTKKKLPAHTVADSKEGWCDALTLGLKIWYSGRDIAFDYSLIRPAGSRLKTMGGKASGPEPLRSLLEFAREKIFRRQGRRLRSIDAHDIICKIGECVVAGGVRRTAMISLSDLDDTDLRDAKKGQFFLTEPYRSVANNSAVYETKPSNTELIEEWAALMKSGSGERGIFNRGALQNTLPKRRAAYFKKRGFVNEDGVITGPIGTNPCVTGDTLVYVADGRGHIPIRQLAEEGKDVPVFCFNDADKLAVRYMRNPRVTGRNAEVYRVILDDGSVIRATANHKFRLRDGTYKEVGHLSHGDSLAIVTKFEASIKDIFPLTNSNAQNYWWINRGLAGNEAEHRLIASFCYQTAIPRHCVVHHKDRNAENNAPDNLEIMSKARHDALHAGQMVGEMNPMRRAAYEWSSEKWTEYRMKHSRNNSGENNRNFSCITDEGLHNHALMLTKLLDRRFSNHDWIKYAKENSLPQSFSKWRRDHLGGISGLAKWAALELGLEHIGADPRVVTSYEKYTKLGYNCEIVNGQLSILKNCEMCGATFRSTITTRECGICSISCGLAKKWRDNDFREANLLKMRTAHDAYRETMRKDQAKVYSDLTFQLGRTPLKEEWRNACLAAGISFEISRYSSPFQSYQALKEAAHMVNHKVVLVEFAGYEDVYNGTVDEFHNFFVGGFSGKTKNGKRKFVYINNLQCGEILLQSKQFCNLSEVIARASDTHETLIRKVRLAALLGTYQSTLTHFQYISKEWKKHCDEERLLGVSITGQWDSEAVRNPETLRAMRDMAVKANAAYAKRFGIKPSLAVTAVKPSGTVSQTFNCSSGIHPRHSKYYIRRVRISATDSLFKMLKDQGVPHYPEVGQSPEGASTFVLEFPVEAPSGSVFKDDLSALEQLEYWKVVKLNYTEHNPSATISVGENEWIGVVDWLQKNWDIIGGLSFLPRFDHVYRLAPYETIDQKRYEGLTASFPAIDYGKLVTYERTDETEQKKELACVGGICDIDMLVPEVKTASAN